MAVNPLKIHLLNILPKNEEISLRFKEVGASLEFVIGHEMMHNLEEGKIKYEIHINLLDANKRSIADCRYDFFFEIDDFEDHYQIINDRPFFDVQFVAALLGIVYSTTRGILLGKFEKTPLKGQILPVINVFDLVSSLPKI